jgi:two-component system NarL family response regulator
MTAIKLMLVDDHFVVRMGLAASLGLEPDIEIVAECDSGERAILLFEQHRPDVVVMDNQLPGMSGSDAAAAIRQQSPDARIVVLSVHDGEEDIFRAERAGVVGYLHKAAPRDEIVTAIRAAAAGDTYFPPAIAAKLAARQQQASLSKRELEVLRLIVDGCSNKEIARALNLAQVTVKLHVGHILEKLKVVDRTQAATTAIQRGIVHLADLRDGR